MPPASGNIYSSNAGVKLVKITIASHYWQRTSTFRRMYDLVNTDNAAKHKLRPIGGPWPFSNRIRILASGHIFEDTDM